MMILKLFGLVFDRSFFRLFLDRFPIVLSLIVLRLVSDRSFFDRSVSDRSFFDRSVSDRSFFDRSVSDRSFFDRS